MSEDARLEDRVDEATPPRLLRQGGERLLGAVMRSFLDHWHGRVEQLSRALEQGDLPDAARIAHGLRSSSQLVGAVRLGRMCGAVELLADGGDGREAARVARELPTAFEEVRPWLEQHASP